MCSVFLPYIHIYIYIFTYLHMYTVDTVQYLMETVVYFIRARPVECMRMAAEHCLAQRAQSAGLASVISEAVGEICREWAPDARCHMSNGMQALLPKSLADREGMNPDLLYDVQNLPQRALLDFGASKLAVFPLAPDSLRG